MKRTRRTLVWPAWRIALLLLSSALLSLEGLSSLGIGLPVAGWGGVRMAFDVALGLGLAILAGGRWPMSAVIRRSSARAPMAATAWGGPLVFTFALTLALVGGFALFSASALVVSGAPARYYVTDVTAFTDECARLALSGHNPYTDTSGFVEALRRFPHVTPTPLRDGAFGSGEIYPPIDLVRTVERRYLADSSSVGGAFDPRTLTSYPALSFLLYVPLLWAGVPDILLLDLAIFLAVAGWLALRAPRASRWWAAVVVLGASLPMLLYSLIADTEVVALAFVLVAWRWRDRPWASAVTLGLACAFRQYCWFFAIFLLADVLFERGWREALRRGLIAVGAFLAPNLPFIVASPGAWWQSIWLPMTAPLFPYGVGLVAVSRGGLLPFAPAVIYTALEALAIGICLWALWRWRSALRHVTPLLALIPIYFAWRSLPNYFAVVPLLSLYAIVSLMLERQPGAGLVREGVDDPNRGDDSQEQYVLVQ